MGNVMDYLEWRGDLTFDQSPFNDVDNVILSQLAYVNFRDVIPSVQMNKGITLKAAAQLFFDLHTEEELMQDKSFIKDAPKLLKKAAQTNRFRDVILSDYVDMVDETLEKQFGAFHIKLSPQCTYVAFRGTDDTLVGWKEDFNMSFISPVPSQEDAVKYLDDTCSYIRGKLYVGGHSKGGNLAMYAAMQCNEILQEKILSVYDNDGPGFPEEFFSPERVEKVLPKVTRIIPEASVIGMLLTHQKEPLIVASSQKGILQHDAFTWEVMGPSFIQKETLTRRAAASDRSLHKWIDTMNEEERAHLIGELFSVLEATGADTISQIQDGGLKSLAAMVRQLDKMEPHSKAMVQELIVGIFGSWLELLPLPELDKKRFLP